jgi:hypothetical protein
MPTDLSREIQVIGCGMSRTGTLSFSLALSRLLNGPVHHGGSAVFLREECVSPSLSPLIPLFIPI